MKNIFKEEILNILLFLLIIIVPLQTRYFLSIYKIDNIFFEYGTIAIYATDIYIIFLIIYLFFYNLKNKLFKFNNKTKTFSILLILFNLFLNLSLLRSINKNSSIYFNIRFFVFSCLAFLLSFIKIDKKYIKDGFICSSLIESIIAIYQFASQKIVANKFLGLANHFPYDPGTSVIEKSDGRFLRAYGLLPHPNILGVFLVIGFIFLCIKILQGNIKNKYSSYLILGIIFIGIIVTFSRLSLLLLLIFFIIYIFRHYFLKREKLEVEKFLSIFCVLLSIFLIFKDLIFTRIIDSRLNNISNYERKDQYVESVNIIKNKNNFLFGIGERNYTFYIHNANNVKGVYDLKSIHNIYFLSLNELGIFGFITFIILLLSPLLINNDSDIKLVYFILLVSGFFDHFLMTENFGIFILMLFIGIMFSKQYKLE
ncbi:MAG TPA: O-antigen ligase family protein [bacterium]|nr:O-antigen ligase family protein [Patescibacteria group bacterium]HOC96222.1 O-antigen ligase family protein [bacterium]HPO11198.1 O-antigen ligase family protein [bacterium]HQL11972.1 O-antigen ligase family protein [bacterium]